METNFYLKKIQLTYSFKVEFIVKFIYGEQNQSESKQKVCKKLYFTF